MLGIFQKPASLCIADPGSEIVSIAHRKGINPSNHLVGPSSILLGTDGEWFQRAAIFLSEDTFPLTIRDSEACFSGDDKGHKGRHYSDLSWRLLTAIISLWKNCLKVLHPETKVVHRMRYHASKMSTLELRL